MGLRFVRRYIYADTASRLREIYRQRIASRSHAAEDDAAMARRIDEIERRLRLTGLAAEAFLARLTGGVSGVSAIVLISLSVQHGRPHNAAYIILPMLRGGLQFRSRYILNIGIFSVHASPCIAKSGGAG